MVRLRHVGHDRTVTRHRYYWKRDPALWMFVVVATGVFLMIGVLLAR